MMNSIWIVEMWIELRSRWEPTIGASLTRADGRYELSDWKSKLPDDRFRLKKYVIAE